MYEHIIIRINRFIKATIISNQLNKNSINITAELVV